MSRAEAAIEEFKLWLPGEVKYSALKAGYDRKLKRAKLPFQGSTSMYGFLSNEHFNFQRARDEGAYYMPFHGKSAQLQLAKLAAGYIDKAAVAGWLEADLPATPETYVGEAAKASAAFLAAEPWKQFDEGASNAADLPFDETVLSVITRTIMSGLSRMDELPIVQRQGYAEVISEQAMCAGGLTVRLYGQFAEQYLTDDQLVIPPSELASPDQLPR